MCFSNYQFLSILSTSKIPSLEIYFLQLLGENISDKDGLEYDGDKIWPFQSFVEQLILDMFDPLWEVRHGSVMAMREILTHQGANAGVIIPDLRCDSALNIKIKERVDKNTVKRERPIDLRVDDNTVKRERPIDLNI
ncbi:TATA-binding protein-associated factor BTAF1-like [Lycium barbarum]|uniref:TATA-binding protein-associated factor BTAF1-like n=1 Tax=Lycium barbarum TaxID=112863 RepID=UPI00293EECB9|nr:TATA-binding protein-associated factor BTAF1-like [Lycium barbarum]